MDKTQILVVEDDRSVQNLITVTLKAEGYRYLTAVTGQAAVIAAATHNPDIVLLDLGLPDMDGVEVIRRIRSWSNMPIIVISARSEDTDKIDALDAGADDYLTKPFSVAELLARLRVTLRRITNVSAEPTASVFENGDLRIDYSAGCVSLAGEEIRLTPIEYKLLCLLSRKTALPAFAERREGADPQVHHPEHLGEQPGQHHRIAARVHGNAAKKTEGFP